LTGYSDAELQAQFDNLSKEYGAQGVRFQKLFTSYVAGINAYINATLTNPALLPGDYAVTASPPQPWTVKDIIAIAGLVGGIFGKGGGSELANAGTLQYLTKEIGKAKAQQAFDGFRERNDPLAPVTTEKRFPYDIPGKLDPSTLAMPDSETLHGGPTDTTANCDLTAPNVKALTIMSSALQFPSMLSNALVVDGKHSTTGHPIAVFGPQVGYFTPQILMEQELHGPDLVAEGASFAGTNGIVELGRGEDYAWSATSAGTDNVDTRLERLCNPTGGAVDPEQKDYLFKGTCLPMKHHTFSETGVPLPGGLGAPVTINHELYYTVHGPVQGWTTSGGKPVAVTSQRSTYAHELDSGIGFLAWNTPSLTHDATSWMKGAGEIGYTFNWFYVDDKDIAYYVSGANPTRPKNINPDFPTWGDGTAEWLGMEPFAEHPHEINPPQGYFTSWNNKPAPGFSASDNQYAYGSVFRSLSLDEGIAQQLAKHRNKLTRSNLVQAMSSASTVDLSGRRVLPELLPYLSKVPLDATGKQMVGRLKAWLATGAHRIKARASDTQYKDADAVAMMDELYPRIIQALYDPLFKNGGVSTTDGLTFNYSVFPQRFADTPNARGAHLGSAYDGGFESFLLTSFRQLRGVKVADAFPSPVTSRVCAGNCPAALAKAFKDAEAALTAANGSATVTSWVNNTANKSAGQTQPRYDAIQYTAVGIVGQDAADWQNRPTFQQVAMFPAHRPRAGVTSRPVEPTRPVRSPAGAGQLPTTGPAGAVSVLALLVLVAGLLLRRSRQTEG
ncbi:MAG: putative penicillin acylase, partial [Frankiales bacterium]|nr:putative penicillin acylase [Frankiales bacterium]